MTEPKLCKDCRWAINPTAQDERPLLTRRSYDWVCGHLGARLRHQPDYVTGQPIEARRDKCLYVRDDPQRCGPEGRWWEPGEAGHARSDEPIEVGFGP
jgi:hypothetical protein